MRPLFLATVGMLSLLCTACASHRVTSGPVRSVAKPAAPAAASTGAAEYHPGELFGITEIDGTASDKHSDLASKTPDGGKSDAAKPPAAGTPAPAATDASVADADKAAKDKAAADKAASDGSLDAGILDAAGNGGAKGSEVKPIDGSDPSIGRPSTAPSRKLT